MKSRSLGLERTDRLDVGGLYQPGTIYGAIAPKTKTSDHFQFSRTWPWCSCQHLYLAAAEGPVSTHTKNTTHGCDHAVDRHAIISCTSNSQTSPVLSGRNRSVDTGGLTWCPAAKTIQWTDCLIFYEDKIIPASMRELMSSIRPLCRYERLPRGQDSEEDSVKTTSSLHCLRSEWQYHQQGNFARPHLRKPNAETHNWHPFWPNGSLQILIQENRPSRTDHVDSIQTFAGSPIMTPWNSYLDECGSCEASTARTVMKRWLHIARVVWWGLTKHYGWKCWWSRQLLMYMKSVTLHCNRLAIKGVDMLFAMWSNETLEQ